MKVFFSMSFRGDVAIGRKIYKILSQMGHKHTSTCFAENETVPTDFYAFSKTQLARHYAQIFSELAAADLVVEEASIQSVTTGQVIQKALDNRIPVLVLHTKGNKPFFLDGIEVEERRMLIVEYNEENLEEVLKEGVDYLSEELSSRFTMILPNTMLKFLDEASDKGVSKSDYIRKLITEKMEEQAV